MRSLLAIAAVVGMFALPNGAHAASCPPGTHACPQGICCGAGEACSPDGDRACLEGRRPRTGVRCGNDRCPPGYYCHSNPHGPPSCGLIRR